MEWSPNGSFPACPRGHFPLLMGWLSPCTEEPLNQCSLMKIKNSSLIAGVHSAHVDRNAGTWGASGCGTCVWNWAIASIQPQCVPATVLPLTHTPFRPLLLSHSRRSPTGCHNGRTRHRWEELPPLSSRHKPMARCSVRQDCLSLPRNAVLNARAADASCLLLGSASVEPACCELTAWDTEAPPRSHVG